MLRIAHYFIFLLLTISIATPTWGQVIFEDDFELGVLKNEWTATPNFSGTDGIIEILDNIGTENSKGLRIGKTTDNSGFTENILDLRLDLTNYKHVAMSFEIADSYDGNDDKDGIYLSDNAGGDFIQVVSFKPEEWCNNRLSKHPPLDIDKLAALAGLNLTNEFIIRFHQRGDKDFNGNAESNEDGFVLDNVSVYDPELIYARLPLNDDFETGQLESYWSWSFADETSIVTSTGPITSPMGIVQVQSGVGLNNTFGVLMGRECDGEFSVNALDLHLNLEGEDNVELSFLIADSYDNTDSDDGIYFSDNGGAGFKKVLDFYPEEWCNNALSEHPPLDVDKLAKAAGLNLTSQFIIRFQQRGEDDFGGNAETNEDGFFLDNINVYDPNLVYSTLPFEDDFENGLFNPSWAWNFADLTSSVSSSFAITSPISTIEVVEDNIYNGTYGVAMGRICDDVFTVNALDLHLNLSGESNVEMSFWIGDAYDNTDIDDGIYFSDDGGENFVKVVDFFPEEWCNNLLSKHPPLDIDKLALAVGLSLTEQFVIRFQQRGQDDFGGNAETNEDGFFIDDVKVYNPQLVFSNVPFEDDFETGLLKNAWAWNFADATATVSTNFNITSPMNIVEVQNGEGRENSYGVVVGRACDGASTVNALDLHLNLQNITNAELSFWIADSYDNTDLDDGIFFSEDGGVNFTKVFNFDFSNTPNNSFEEYKLAINDLATNNSINLTNTFVIRFQQRGENDFGGNSESNEDGFFLDDVQICVNDNCTPAPPTTLDVTVSNTLENCEQSNGTATAQATNGTAPYTYLWSNGGSTPTIDNLIAGAYTVTVTDANGDTANGSTTILDDCTSGCTYIVTPATNSASCEQSNGSIDLTITGGNGTYIFNWSNGATTQNLTNIPTGNYSVTIFESITECNITLDIFVGDDCGGMGECGITDGTLTFPNSPYTTNSSGQLIDVVGEYMEGSVPNGYDVRFIKIFSNRAFLSIRDTPEFRHSGAVGTKRMYYIIGQFTDVNDPNYIDIDNTDYESIADLREAIEGKCAILEFSEYEFVGGDDYILTAEEAEGPINTPILLPVKIQGGNCNTLQGIQGQFQFADGAADVTILDYVSGKINADEITRSTSTQRGFIWESPTGIDLSPTEDDTLFYLQVSLSGNPRDISRVYFDTLERPLVVVTCTDRIIENIGLGVGLLRIIDNVDIEGEVRFWKNNEGIGGVDMNLITNQAGNFSEQTDNTGDYIISGVPTGGTGTLTPSKTNTAAANGLNVLDALFLKQYVVGLVDVNSDYQRVAMEVSGDKDINVIDALLIELVILGNPNDFSPVADWIFIPESHTFPAPYTADYFNYPTQLDIPDIRTDIEEPFIGIKTGDVDGSADPNNLRNQTTEDRDRRKQDWQYQTNYKKSEELLEVTLSPTTDITTAALQTQLAWTDTDKLELVSAKAMALSAIRTNTQLDNQVRLLWVSSGGQYLDFAEETPMIQLTFKVKEGFDVKEWKLFPVMKGLSSIIVNENNDELALSLSKLQDVNTSNSTWTHQLFQNTPNPFTDFTSIQFSLPQTEMVNFSVYDSYGKRVYQEVKAYNSGKQELRLTTNEWAPGLYTCTMQTNHFNAAIKMLVIR